jgi:hypothetical protein
VSTRWLLLTLLCVAAGQMLFNVAAGRWLVVYDRARFSVARSLRGAKNPAIVVFMIRQRDCVLSRVSPTALLGGLLLRPARR